MSAPNLTTINDKMPVQLGNSPLVEAIFELRFEATMPAAGDILPGLLYAVMKDEFSTVIPLPVANIPREFRERQADLRYQASHQLRGEGKSVQIGDRMVAVTSAIYPGWERFKPMVEFLIDALKHTNLVKQVERFSFKYLNIIEAAPDEPQLNLLNARIELMGSPTPQRGFRLRTERDDETFISIIEIIPDSSGKKTQLGKQVKGLLLTVDTIKSNLTNDFLTNPAPLIEDSHSVLKKIFFSLLTEKTLGRLEPIWS